MNKFKLGAVRAKVQATSLFREAGTKIVSTSSDIAQRSFTLPGLSRQAGEILKSFLADPDDKKTALNAIPKPVLLRAKGLAVFRVIKAGFVFSGKAGSGIVIARLPDGSWSAPSCIGTGGLGWGLQIGADVTDFVIVLNSDEAVRAFSKGGNVTIGGNLSAAAGPIGTGAAVQTALLNPAPMLSYSKSQGLFAGISLEGTVLVELKDVNKKFYCSEAPLSAEQILRGVVPPPEDASTLYDTIERAEGLDDSQLPDEAYIPSTTGEHLNLPSEWEKNKNERTVFDADAGTHGFM